MRTLFLSLISISTLLSFAGISHAQWEAGVRLTNDTNFSYTSFNNAWCIASDGNNQHVTWWDRRDGNYEIYYKRSTDAGLTWGADVRLTNESTVSEYPSIAVMGSAVHVVWWDRRDNNAEIYYKRSTDGGITWGSDTRLTIDSAVSIYPCVSVSGSFVHVVWEDKRSGSSEIFYKRSTDNGNTWGSDVRLTNNTAHSGNPSIAVSGSVLHVAWYDMRDGNFEIYYKRSDDGGSTWGSDTRLTNDAAASGNPSIAVSGSVVNIIWQDARISVNDYEIYYKRSSDGGLTWGSDVRLSNIFTASLNGSLAASGSAVHLVWNEGGTANEIYYKRSTDAGLTWEPNVRLTNNIGNSYLPSVSASGSIVNVVWHDNVDGNYEIYYKRNPTGNAIGIEIISSEVPMDFSLNQNYPNPFNPSTRIRFDIPSNLQSAICNLKLYDVLGREISTLVNEQLKPGTYEVEWNGTKYTSGVYFYRLNTDGFSQTRKMVLNK